MYYRILEDHSDNTCKKNIILNETHLIYFFIFYKEQHKNKKR